MSSITPQQSAAKPGPIRWMAHNSVAANLIMIAFLVGGTMIAMRIKQEVFPEFDLDLVSIRVLYPGASPAEVEQGIILSIEEAVRGLDGIKRVTAEAREGMGTVNVELLLGANNNKAQADIKNAVDRIITFPLDAEEPIVSLATNRREVISVVVHGDQPEEVIRNYAEWMREGLLAKPNITLVDLEGIRPREIGIEIPIETLRAHNLTLEQVSSMVSRSSVELPGGGVKTPKGEVLMRMDERRDWGREFAEIPIISRPDGTQVRLGELAEIEDGFEDNDQLTLFEGQRAAMVRVFRVGDQTPIDVARTVKQHIDEIAEHLPDGIHVTFWQDWSEIFEQRMNLLLRNAALGLTLVLLVLGLFLEMRLAFWVAMGILVSIVGSFLLLPSFDVSINMISLFAFIVTLGIVVDDAIVVGENVYEYRQRGMSKLDAAVAGTREVAVPLVFSVLTNIAAFMPMFFVPGVSGKIFMQIPAIVVAVFAISLIESLFVLPAHLGHSKQPGRRGPGAFLHHQQQRFSRGVDWTIKRLHEPLLRFCLHWRYMTVATGLALLIGTFGLVMGGRVGFTFFPRVEGDMVTVSATLPFGSPVEETERINRHLLGVARDILDDHGGDEIKRGLLSRIGSAPQPGGPGAGRGAASGGHITSIQVYLVPMEGRSITVRQFADEWRRGVGPLPEVETLSFRFTLGPTAGSPIDVELSHGDIATLERAATDLAAVIASYDGVIDVDPGYSLGKPQMSFQVRPEARSLGLTAADIGRQVRGAFYGAEAARQQRGRDEVRVMVRLPLEERRSIHDVQELILRTPQGGEVPLFEATEIERGYAYTSIRRRDGRRVVNVTADIAEGQANANEVTRDMAENVLPALVARHEGLVYSLEGEQREQRESMVALGQGFVLTLIAIYAMLAIPFRSYVQPMIVMSAIPFGIVGAVFGHVIMGPIMTWLTGMPVRYDLSLMSMFGIIAMAGVVVNNSLVLIHTANRFRDEGESALDAIVHAGVRRFRPINLTSFTTFFGLAPMIFETSVQARFLVPMAISLGFGVLFVTFIALILVPALYIIVEDIKDTLRAAYAPTTTAATDDRTA